jgi:hypothetical protein
MRAKEARSTKDHAYDRRSFTRIARRDEHARLMARLWLQTQPSLPFYSFGRVLHAPDGE